jgi:hypothetical protein
MFYQSKHFLDQYCLKKSPIVIINTLEEGCTKPTLNVRHLSGYLAGVTVGIYQLAVSNKQFTLSS